MPKTAEKRKKKTKSSNRKEKVIPPQWEFDGELAHAKVPIRRLKRTPYPEDFKRGDIDMLSYQGSLKKRLTAAATATKTCKDTASLKVFFGLLTPDLAKFLLLYRAPNRKFKRSVIEDYATDIAGGLWVVTGQPVILDQHGRLIDGQQRCAAVNECGKSIRVLFVTGVPTRRFDDVDTGTPRTLKDMIAAMRDEDGLRLPYSDTVGSAMILGVHYARLVKSNSGCISRKKVKQHWGPRLWKAFPEFSSAALVYLNDEVKKGLKRIGITASVAVSSMLFTFDHNSAKSDDFWTSLASGEGFSKRSPLAALRNFLLDYIVSAKARPKEAAEWSLDVLIQAWNLFMAGKSCAKGLMRTESGRPFPQFVKSQSLMRRILKGVREG